MSSRPVTVLATLGGLALVLATGCPDDPVPKENPGTLWLAPQDSELDVQLVEDEPPPF